MGKVHFELSADETKAVQAYLKVVDVQGRAVAGFKDMARHGRGASSEMGKVANELKGLAMGFISFRSAGTIIQDIFQGIKDRAEAMRGFEKEMKGLFAQGNNVTNMKAIRHEVLALSTAYSQTTADVANAKEAIEQGLDELGGDTQKKALKVAMDLSDVLGMELPESTALAITGFQLFGDKLGNVAKATDRLWMISEAVGHKNPAEFLKAVGPAAIHAGASVDELTASISVFGRAGGRDREATTSMRALFEGTDQALRKGLIPDTGSFVDKLEAIQKYDSVGLKSVLGDAPETSLALIARLLDRLKKVKENAEDLARKPGGQLQSMAIGKLADADARSARMLEAAASVNKNAIAGIGTTDLVKQVAEEIAFTEAGVARQVPDIGPLRFLAKWGSLATDDPVYTKEGRIAAIEALTAAGKRSEADLIRLRDPRHFGMDIATHGGVGIYPGEAQIKQFAEMNAKHPWFTAEMAREMWARDFPSGDRSYGEYAAYPRFARSFNRIPVTNGRSFFEELESRYEPAKKPESYGERLRRKYGYTGDTPQVQSAGGAIAVESMMGAFGPEAMQAIIGDMRAAAGDLREAAKDLRASSAKQILARHHNRE